MNGNISPDPALLDQAALYAIDALPSDEAARFRAFAQEAPSLADLVADYEAAGALLAETLSPMSPPPELRRRILGSPAGEIPPHASSAHHSSAAVFVPWGVAAALAVSLGLMWLENQQLTIEKSTLRDRATLLGDAQRQLEALRSTTVAREKELSALRERVTKLERPDAPADIRLATLTSKLNPTHLATVAWEHQAQKGILKIRFLPVAERGQDYQLWVIDPNHPSPISGGVFAVQADGSATIRFAPARKVSALPAFAVSLEPSGGSALPQGDIVLSE